MDRNKPPKKTETVEIRLPHATKTAFMARCRDEGRTASDAIRRFIDAELNATSSARPQPRLGWRPLLAAAVAGLALGDGLLGHASTALPPVSSATAARAAVSHARRTIFRRTA